MNNLLSVLYVVCFPPMNMLVYIFLDFYFLMVSV